MVATVPFADKIGFDKGVVVGYTGIVLSFLLVFFGIRSYRDNEGNGRDHLLEGFYCGDLYYRDFLPLLCGDLGNYLFQLHA